MAILIVFRITPKWTMLFSPVIFVFLILFSLGLSYILATAYVFFGDVKHLYSVVLTLWMYCSAIFYPVDQLSGAIREIIVNNPIYNYIACLREVVMYGTLPSLPEIVRMVVWAVGMYIVGYLIFRKNKNNIMQKI